jgi:glycerate 2-kinase
MLSREACEQAFHQAVKDCDPAARVYDALAREPVRGAHVLGLAVGKAALAMARGAGGVARGLVVTPADDGRGLPPRWQLLLGGHPVPDARSEAAGRRQLRRRRSSNPLRPRIMSSHSSRVVRPH